MHHFLTFLAQTTFRLHFVSLYSESRVSYVKVQSRKSNKGTSPVIDDFKQFLCNDSKVFESLCSVLDQAGFLNGFDTVETLPWF